MVQQQAPAVPLRQEKRSDVGRGAICDLLGRFYAARLLLPPARHGSWSDQRLHAGQRSVSICTSPRNMINLASVCC